MCCENYSRNQSAHTSTNIHLQHSTLVHLSVHPALATFQEMLLTIYLYVVREILA
jgi:hypothetical protein